MSDTGELAVERSGIRAKWPAVAAIVLTIVSVTTAAARIKTTLDNKADRVYVDSLRMEQRGQSFLLCEMATREQRERAARYGVVVCTHPYPRTIGAPR
jgi:hypothetical protein